MNSFPTIKLLLVTVAHEDRVCQKAENLTFSLPFHSNIAYARAKAVSGIAGSSANQTTTWQEAMKERGVYVTIWSVVFWSISVVGCLITSFDRVTLIFYSVIAVSTAAMATFTLFRLR